MNDVTSHPWTSLLARGAKVAATVGAAIGLTLVVAVPAAHADPADPVTVPDARLLECMNAALSTPQAPTHAITEGEAATIDELSCSLSNVNDITGIESLTNATVIDLSYNNITDASPLAGLTGLQDLSLSGNGLPNLAFLDDLDALRILRLTDAGIDHDDTSYLADKTLLTTLALGGNDLVNDNLSFLNGMMSLQFLYLTDTGISNISPVENLGAVQYLYLGDNSIEDVSALENLSNLVTLNLANNAIVDVSPLEALTASVNVSDQSVELGPVTVGNAQPNPVVDFDGNPVTLDAPYDSDPAVFTPTTAGPGSASWSGATFSGSLTFTANDPGPFVNIPDEQLLMCINQALDPARDADEEVTEAEAATIAQLFCDDNGVNDLTGIEFLTAATSIDLKRNNISDVGPLENLTSLTYLNLAWNDIENIDALGNLTSLTSLYLRSNSISDISALSSLSSVTLLSLHGNEITDVGPLSGLTALNTIYLAYNNITDVSPLAGIVAAIDVTNQMFNVGAVTVGAAVSNPVVGYDGSPMPLDALYQSGANTFTPTAVGPGSTTWDNGGEITMFSGTLSFQAAAAPGDGDDGSGDDVPVPGDTVDTDPATPGDPDPATPGGTDDGSGEPTLAATGVEPWVATALAVAAALGVAGALAIHRTRRVTASTSIPTTK